MEKILDGFKTDIIWTDNIGLDANAIMPVSWNLYSFFCISFPYEWRCLTYPCANLKSLESTNEQFQWMNFLIFQMDSGLTMNPAKTASTVSIMDLGKMLLVCAKDGDTSKVHELMSRGAPFTTDWVRFLNWFRFRRKELIMELVIFSLVPHRYIWQQWTIIWIHVKYSCVPASAKMHEQKLTERPYILRCTKGTMR